jgi:hypothetical protein
MMAPRLQWMRGQDPTDGRRGDVLHEPVRAELPRQFGTVPLGETTAAPIGALAR